MKNSLKIGALIVGVIVCIAACDPPQSKVTQAPIDTTQKTGDTGSKAAIDTVKKDTSKKM